MCLSEIKAGSPCRLCEIVHNDNTVRRLSALGLTPGAPLTVLARGRTGRVVVRVRGTRLALGSNIAGAIVVASTELTLTGLNIGGAGNSSGKNVKSA